MKTSWLAQLLPWFYFPNLYGYSHARHNGIAEGRANAQNQPYAYELKNAFEGWINELAEDWAERDKKLKADYCSALQALKRAQATLDDVRNQLISREQAESAIEKLYKEELGSDHMNPIWYSLFMIFFGVFELPINKVVIEALGLAGWEQWIAAAGVSIFLVGAAHFLGRYLKQGSADRLTRTEMGLVAASLSVPAATLGFIAVLREKYVIKLNALGLDITETQVLLLFFSINVLFFAVGTLFSFTYHDPEGTRIRRSFTHDKSQTKKSRSERDKAENLVQFLQDRLNKAAAIREHTHSQYFKKIRAEKDDFERLLSVYRKYKQRELSRNNFDLPSNIVSSIFMDVPPTIARRSQDNQVLELSRLDTSCPPPT